MNTPSIQLHIDELKTVLTKLNHTFDIILISESKLKNDPIINIYIPGYNSPYLTKTEANKGGTMIYAADGINCKPKRT